MSSLEEKLKEMEPAQIGIYALLGVVAIFLVYSLFSGSDETEEETKTEFAMPDDRNKVKDYNDKLEAYSRSNEKTESKISLEFDINDFSTDDNKVETDREKLEKEVDSMLNQNKIEYSQKPKKTTNHSTNSTRRTTPKTSSRKSNTGTVNNQQKNNQDINKSFDDFFSSNPEPNNSEDNIKSKTDPFIYAVIHGNQTIKQTQRVKIRLTKKALIGGKTYERNSYIYASPRFQTNRVHLNITSVNHIPVDISAYDAEDSSPGIYVEGAVIVGEIGDEGTKETLDDVDVGGVPVGTAIKNVFRKKQQEPTVTLLNNTKLILKPNQ